MRKFFGFIVCLFKGHICDCVACYVGDYCKCQRCGRKVLKSKVKGAK